jgi:hypothetical protein
MDYRKLFSRWWQAEWQTIFFPQQARAASSAAQLQDASIAAGL